MVSNQMGIKKKTFLLFVNQAVRIDTDKASAVKGNRKETLFLIRLCNSCKIPK